MPWAIGNVHSYSHSVSTTIWFFFNFRCIEHWAVLFIGGLSPSTNHSFPAHSISTALHLFLSIPLSISLSISHHLSLSIHPWPTTIRCIAFANDRELRPTIPPVYGLQSTFSGFQQSSFCFWWMLPEFELFHPSARLIYNIKLLLFRTPFRSSWWCWW